MHHYVTHSPKLKSDVSFYFHSSGLLCGFKIDREDIQADDLMQFLQGVPTSLNQLQAVCKAYKYPLSHIPTDLSFAAFWKAYGNTKCSKILAEKAYSKLTEAERAAAISYIPRYNAERGTEAQCHATTYINGKRWVK